MFGHGGQPMMLPPHMMMMASQAAGLPMPGGSHYGPGGMGMPGPMGGFGGGMGPMGPLGPMGPMGGSGPSHGGMGMGGPMGGFGAGMGMGGGMGMGPMGHMGGMGGGGGIPPILGPGPPIQKGRTASGPPGANLFIFHVPNDMTNRNLHDLFAPYGNVISARIMVERETGRSRGFGFVSFDNPREAEAAVRAMDG